MTGETHLLYPFPQLEASREECTELSDIQWDWLCGIG